MSARDETMPEGSWAFDESVTEAFDDMLERSIPQYELMRETVLRVGTEFIRPDTMITDLGCSNGLSLDPLVKRFGAHNRYFGVDVSEPMLAAARERFHGYEFVRIESCDLRTDYPPTYGGSLTLSILALQFTPIEYRSTILANARDHLDDGGALILVEKVLGETAELHRLMTDTYHERKREQGYTDEQILRKAAALEGVLVPLTASFNEAMLRSAGFRVVECFWRWMNFAAWIAVR